VPTLQPIGRRRGILAPLLLIPLLCIGGCQSQAPASDTMVGPDIRWRITGQAGLVSLRSPGQSFWQRSIPGMTIAPKSEIATFDGSRVELASAGDKVTASGSSEFAVAAADQNGIRIRQQAGSLRYKVRSAPQRRFEVKTPHFSTVVKGTSFLVSIDRAGSAVAVDEGVVLILGANGEPLAELTTGQIGRMAGQPGAAFEVSTLATPAFEGTEPGAGSEPSLHGNTGSSETINDTGAALTTPTNEPGVPAAEPSFFERIESFFGYLAAQLSSAGALTSGALDPSYEQGTPGRGHDGHNASNLFDASHGIGASNAMDNSKGSGGSKGKGNSHGNGKGKDRGESGGRGNDKGKGHSSGGNKGAGGRRADLILNRDEGGPVIAWSAYQ
jgi:hypothetical protein